MLACGGSSSPGGAPGQSSSCTATLSGAVTGSFDCKPATTAWSSSNNQGGFGFSVSTPVNTNVAIGWPGEPQNRHYKNSDAGATGGVTVIQGASAWLASGSQGSYDLNVTNVTNPVSASSGKVYTTDGTLDATLVPSGGAAGSVTVHVVF
jgi:hypothetical protein